MLDDHPQAQPTAPAGIPSSSSPPPQSPSRKRLLADLKPQNGSSSDSALSSDSSSDQYRKKTRDLPNLSDCHGCGVRINNTNPKEKLQTLNSLWRIVLLCRRCVKHIESAEFCSYCFSSADADSYRCPVCERRVHRDCVVRYKSSAPWSYCSSEVGFSVCVDCWVPKSLSISNKVHSRRNKKKSKLCSEGDSRVSSNANGAKLMVNVASVAKSAVEKKIVVAAKAKEHALRKAVVARRAVELANGALELVAMKDEKGKKNEGSVSCNTSGSHNTGSVVLDDAQLAIRLHRAMNSSPRISKNLCLVNSNLLPLPRMRDDDGNSLVRSSGSRGRFDFTYQRRGNSNSRFSNLLSVSRMRDDEGNLLARSSASKGRFNCTYQRRGSSNSRFSGMTDVCTTSKLNENTDAVLLEPSVSGRSLEIGYVSRVGNLKQELLVYKRKCQKSDEYQEKGEGFPGNSGDNLVLENQTCQNEDGLEYILCVDDNRCQSDWKCNGNAMALDAGKCNGQLDNLDRGLLKYRRRFARLKEIKSGGSKILYVGPCVESTGEAVGLPAESGEGSKMLSSASFLSCTVGVPASTFASSSVLDTT